MYYYSFLIIDLTENQYKVGIQDYLTTCYKM